MSKKNEKIARLIEGCGGTRFDPHYVGFYTLFNSQFFFEAHDVLEKLWLADRQGPNFSFYKGLIQLAGAFVHLQKERLKPAAALFKLADANLAKYPCSHQGLNITVARGVIAEWLTLLESTNFQINPLKVRQPPSLDLMVIDEDHEFGI